MPVSSTAQGNLTRVRSLEIRSAQASGQRLPHDDIGDIALSKLPSVLALSAVPETFVEVRRVDRRLQPKTRHFPLSRVRLKEFVQCSAYTSPSLGTGDIHPPDFAASQRADSHHTPVFDCHERDRFEQLLGLLGTPHSLTERSRRRRIHASHVFDT